MKTVKYENVTESMLTYKACDCVVEATPPGHSPEVGEAGVTHYTSHNTQPAIFYTME